MRGVVSLRKSFYNAFPMRLLTREKTAQVADRGLEEGHLGRGLVKVDLGHIVQDLLDDLLVAHDKSRGERVDRTRAPAISIDILQLAVRPLGFTVSPSRSCFVPVIFVSVCDWPQGVMGEGIFIIAIPPPLEGLLDSIRPLGVGMVSHLASAQVDLCDRAGQRQAGEAGHDDLEHRRPGHGCAIQWTCWAEKCPVSKPMQMEYL